MHDGSHAMTLFDLHLSEKDRAAVKCFDLHHDGLTVWAVDNQRGTEHFRRDLPETETAEALESWLIELTRLDGYTQDDRFQRAEAKRRDAADGKAERENPWVPNPAARECRDTYTWLRLRGE